MDLRRTVIYLFVAFSLQACTTVALKRCQSPVEDEDIWDCHEIVQGIYRDCEKPKDLFRCIDPP